MSKFKFKPRRSIDGPGTVNNGQRAEWAATALAVYRQGRYPDSDDNTDPLKDLISDLLHFADRECMDDVEEMLQNARARWQEER